MDESEDNMSAEDIRAVDSPLSVKNKPKKRSLVERELETNLTARVTSPVTGEGTSTSRYGRARRLKTKSDMEAEKVMKPLRIDTSKSQPQAYKMHASNSPIRKESPKQAISVAGSIEDQIENIYNENVSLSRFGSEEQAKTQSPAKKFSKVYIRKDLIQKPDTDTVTMIKNMFSPVNKSNTHLNNILERSSEKYLLNGHGKPRNGFPNSSSVVKTLDFDNKKKKKDVKDKTVCKNELFELEAVCEYQVGDLAWARVGTYPFWPCIVTREPFTDMFVKKKLFGRVEHDVIHVTFFGDNGRRGWIVDNMLRKFHGRAEFESAREKFTLEAKKKDPRFYAAHFVSEKKLTLWNISVDEAETLMREPKRLRIEILHDMLEKSRISKATPKREKVAKITRTGSDVSLSESLYDTLFSEDDGKVDESSRTKNPRKNSLDVSEVVTACLDNMAAKSGIIQLQRQSHMDRWLQKAKSKTPEKTQPKLQIKMERERRKEKTKKKKEIRKPKQRKNESLSSKTNLMPYQNEHDYSSVNYENHDINDSSNINTDFEESGYDDTINSSSLEVAVKVESISSSMEDCSQDDIITTVVNDDIVMTDAENISKEVNDCNKIINDTVHDINATNLESTVKLNENEQNETVLELKLSNKKVSNESSRSRRSKRKRQSGEEKNNSIIESNPVKKPLLDLVDSKTAKNTIITNSNIECNNIDDQGNLNDKMIYHKQLGSKDSKNKIKKEMSVEKDLKKDTPKQSKPRKQSLQSELLPLNGPNLVVLIEPLKMDTIEIPCLVKANQNLHGKVFKSKNKKKESIKETEKPETPVIVNEKQANNEPLPSINKEEDTTKENTDKPKDHTKVKEKSSVQNASEVTDMIPVFDEVKNHLNDNLAIPKDVALDVLHTDNGVDKNQKTKNEEVSKENPSCESNENVFDKMDVDDHEIVNMNKDVQLDNLKPDSINSKDPNFPGPLKTETTDTVEPLETNNTNLPLGKKNTVLVKPNATNIVIGEETYIFDRTMSQDYDEIDTEVDEVNNLPIDSSNKEVNNKADVIFKKTSSQDYDEDIKDTVDTQNADLVVTPDPNLSTQVASKEAGGLFVNNDSTFENTLSQEYDGVNKEVAVTENSEMNARSEDNSSTYKVNNENKACDTPVNNDLQCERTLSQDYDEVNKEVAVTEHSEMNARSEDYSCAHEFNNENKACDTPENNDLKCERIVSQDYDEVNKVVAVTENSETNATSEDNVSAHEVNNENKACDPPVNNDLKFERTLSPDYDEVNNVVDIEKRKFDAKLEDNLFTKEDIYKSSKKKNTKTSCDIVECHNISFVDKLSDFNSKEKDQTSVQDTPSLTIEVSPMLPHNETKLLDQALEENTTYPEIGTVTSNNEESNELKAKIRKSPKLSLNKTKKQTIKKSSTLHLPKDTTESHNNTFLDILDNDNVAPSDDKNDSVQLNSDVKHTDLIQLSENKDPKASDFKINGLVRNKEKSPDRKFKEEFDSETASIKSEDSGLSTSRRKVRSKEKQDVKKSMDDPEFLKYTELYQDALIDEQPELTQDEIVTYLYQTWLYEESNKSDSKKTDEAEQSKLVKGLNQEPAPQPRKYKKKPKVEKEPNIDIRDIMPKEKPKRKIAQSKPYYNEDFSDLEEDSDLETFNIFDTDVNAQNEDGEQIDEVELYFEKLTKPKPNVFKGFVREKVCEICERTGNLVKCKGCHAMFHVDCVMKGEETSEVPAPTRGRKKKKKKETRGRKPKGYDESLMDSGSQSDERSQDANISEELSMSMEDEPEAHLTVDAEYFEAQFVIKMKELTTENIEDYFESDQEIRWDAPPGQCEIVDVKQKEKPIDYSDFKCYNCLKYDTPICFVCKSDKSPKGLTEVRKKCQVAHCHRYYHLECLEYWPQTQFTSWEPSKTNKKVMDYIESLSCPRHVCHTCVSDDPRGCRTRFCGDKLARCVKCPATYHSFTKCLPAGTQILTGSQILCPRHYEHRSGKVPCHVNTGWCFICALGGTLICCEYCPTSFHAECLNIKPPEGSYMCEDCETGRLPLYGEMVWVKLGHYRWWPGIVLHPCEIPDNIMAVKHSPGEFVVRFFGQYDHYWVNRGRVFPFQEGDSGKISSQKSKIDAAFTTAMEHAQRACEILKNIEPNEEEEEDIASSLLPPHYVKLKVNKPVGSLTARRDDDANSLTQCDCDPKQPDPCGPYSHCLNRMLLTECGPLCRAGERCNNRAFERRDYPRLAPYRTPHRGWGLRTLEDIKQGQFVIEYVGELIDEEEFRRRMRRKHEVRDENFYFLTLDKERMIDAGPKGNLARFMNHCCEPNCETQKWTVLGDVRVGLFALRDIPANSEVTFNYNLECAGIEKKRCLCGAKRCSGYIGAKPKQEEAQPKKMKVPAKRAYKKRQKVEDSPSSSKTKPPIKIKITKPIKPRELTEIEKDLLIIKNATNGMSSDSESSRLSSVDEKKDPKALKRKRVSFSTEEVISNSSAKKVKLDECKTGDE